VAALVAAAGAARCPVARPGPARAGDEEEAPAEEDRARRGSFTRLSGRGRPG
jgi:hypothetical protein